MSDLKRWDIHSRIQHILLLVSFLILAVTGVPIRYAGSAWARKMTAALGGFDRMLDIHLLGAVVMGIAVVYHLAYHLYRFVKERRWTRSMLPGKKDFADLVRHVRYCLGCSQSDARFDRYTYKEKFEYWAVVWGLFSMGGTGLAMYYAHVSAKFLPRWLLDAAQVAHSGEAMLAIFTIIVWHWFNVILHPSVFPMSRVWLNGKVSRAEMVEFHPLELERLERERGPIHLEEHAGWLSRLGSSRPFMLVQVFLYLVVLAWVLTLFWPLATL